ncbi:hypothetical protein C8J57DRAFT_598331 [Mycena rebaudengoi]|nr:hypothetical protein C8J57DRAFT_598331 [Mycena rebaudengoi]
MTSKTEPDVFPVLPPELERIIFELAATRHPKTMPTLLLVAQRVLHWIQPLLYRTLVFTRSPPCPAPELQPTKFTKFVQNLLIWGGFCFKDSVTLLCSPDSTGIQKLALIRSDPSMLPGLEKMQLRHLLIDLRQLFGPSSAISPARPPFNALTHLTLLNGDARLKFAELPALTHLCVGGARDLASLSSTLVNCATLHVLVNLFWAHWAVELFKEAHDSINDPRFVIMSFTFDDYIGDWMLGANGGNDFWIRAEKFVAKRQRGEIQPASRCWIEESDFIY